MVPEGWIPFDIGTLNWQSRPSPLSFRLCHSFMLGAVTSTVQVDNAQGKTKRVGVFSLAAAGTFVYKTAYCLHFAFITLLRQKRRKLDFQSFGEDMEENEVGSRAETKFN